MVSYDTEWSGRSRTAFTWSHMQPRPSQRECHQKVKAALDAVKDGRRAVVLEKHLQETMEFTGACDAEGLWKTVEALLEELCKQKVSACYAGGYPPQRSYEGRIKDLELWPFRWRSSVLGCDVYLKFCIKKDYFLFVDCHENRDKKQPSGALPNVRRGRALDRGGSRG